MWLIEMKLADNSMLFCFCFFLEQQSIYLSKIKHEYKVIDEICLAFPYKAFLGMLKILYSDDLI